LPGTTSFLTLLFVVGTYDKMRGDGMMCRGDKINDNVLMSPNDKIRFDGLVGSNDKLIDAEVVA